ncbi:MAG: hypothetical protein KDH89_07730, partial [Anaerolineae bacterium]|nr:hypothetical protein [Anaerolineae bacterium]
MHLNPIPQESPSPHVNPRAGKPLLIVFLENGSRVAGVNLPRWASQLLDWSTEEYGKLAVRIQARRHYRDIVVLEDQQATAGHLL